MRKYLFLLSVVILLGACNSDFKHSPIYIDNNPPGPVTDVKVENMNGAARITYKIPGDEDLLYIEGTVEITRGNIRKVQSSFLSNELLFKGFGASEIYQVELFSVDRSGNKSEPVLVDVHPLTPPIVQVFNSLDVVEDFGGVNISYVNESMDNVVIDVFTKDSLGNMILSGAEYTNRSQGDFSVRGLEAVETKFYLVVRDRWDNHSETLEIEKTPLFEEELDKSNFKAFNPPMPNDVQPFRTAVITRLWDDASTDFRADNGSGLPHQFTFDLGVKATLSRYIQLQRGLHTESEYNLLYANGAVKKWEIWGGNEGQAAMDGSYDGWIKLATFESIKPSGLPTGQISNEDLEYLQKGEEFSFPIGIPAIRYIRFKILQTWSGADFSNISEVTFFGDTR